MLIDSSDSSDDESALRAPAAQMTKATSKAVGKATTQHRFNDQILQNTDKPTIRDIRATIDDPVIRTKVEQLLKEGIKGPIRANSEASKYYVLVNRYLLSLIAFSHFQRPGVAQAFTVEEFLCGRWLNDRYIVGVKEHKTATTCPAVFSLTEYHHRLLHRYYTGIRPTDDNENPKTAHFFLRSSGVPIVNVSTELNRLQEQYKKRIVSTNDARHVIETLNQHSALDITSQGGICDYLTHNADVAKRVHKIRDYSEVNTAMMNIERLVSSAINTVVLPSPADVQQRAESEFESESESVATTSSCMS